LSKASNILWEDFLGKRLLLVALALGLLIHGIVIFFTMPSTYDAYVHIFFADHYSRFWFEPWEYRWYTGFLTISYPPLVHQMIALISKVFPLKVAFSIYAILIFEALIVGIYRFSKIFFTKKVAGISAILAVVMSSLVETVHVFGQVPTLTGMAFLLNSLPFLYYFFKTSDWRYLLLALSFLAVVVSSHHVTAIFGMVFFIAPAVWMAILDKNPELGSKPLFGNFFPELLKEIWNCKAEILIFGVVMIFLAINLIFPYWYWSRTDPITQVSIPHGSRDNFFEETSSGLVFYVIPLLLVLSMLPVISFLITRKKRHIGWAVSFYLCLLFGSGGTTPLPKMMLGENAFNILTLDRFGFWASIISIPYISQFIESFLTGSIKNYWQKKFGETSHFLLSGLTGFSYFLFIIYIFHLANFRPLQPSEVEIQPILNFLNRDDHMRWRFLALGFGDQMAWLSANSLGASIDGNYHSARRLPEMTSRAVERLENAKFLKDEGLASLTDFLTDAEKYSLKYIFSNDRYYDPLLFYTGWNRNIQLENGIMVWEKGIISPIQPIRPTEVSPVLKKAWGILPVFALSLAVILTFIYLSRFKKHLQEETSNEVVTIFPKPVIFLSAWLPFMVFSGFLINRLYELLLVNPQKDPITTLYSYYDHLDFQRFEKVFSFFKPNPGYNLDQFLLEKSVKDGGLLPNYAKLDQLKIDTLVLNENAAKFNIQSVWRTSIGLQYQRDTLSMVRNKNSWYILPERFQPKIADEQIISYTYTLFKKMGKRSASSFPTVKDDRLNKPFAAFSQVNLVQNGNQLFLTGEFLNADNIPLTLAMKATVFFAGDSSSTFYPKKNLHYNLSPKANTWFEIELGDIAKNTIESIKLDTEADISERGYIRGGEFTYELINESKDEILLKGEMYNPLTLEITIPGLLYCLKDTKDRVLEVGLWVHKRAIKSGVSEVFDIQINKSKNKRFVRNDIPIDLILNGEVTQPKMGLNKIGRGNFSLLTHCFFSQEIYLQ
jgi:hypothetical protein